MGEGFQWKVLPHGVSNAFIEERRDVVFVRLWIQALI